jgi:hypothetical protein
VVVASLLTDAAFGDEKKAQKALVRTFWVSCIDWSYMPQRQLRIDRDRFFSPFIS